MKSTLTITRLSKIASQKDPAVIVKPKQNTMATWERKPQERNDQQYFFAGKFYMTKGVFDALHFEEIISIYHDVKAFAKQRNGIDYMQVYTDGNGRKLFMIDQLDTRMIESGEYSEEHNYCTLLLDEEY
ncbi:MAG TPA: hypothetical protein VK588_01700 [Chitinophagaceae bacterium]|nr:hypothetical protein [Chitinophagaceae bacterium]